MHVSMSVHNGTRHANIRLQHSLLKYTSSIVNRNLNVIVVDRWIKLQCTFMPVMILTKMRVN